MENNLYIVIVGCGRLGSHLANCLSRDGNSVVAIDHVEAKLNNFSPDFSGFRINGNATQLSVLKEANLNAADVLIATTHEDNINLMVAQIAKKIFHVPHVLARVFDPKRKEIYAKLDIDTICPTSVAAAIFLQAVAEGEKRKNGFTS